MSEHAEIRKPKRHQSIETTVLPDGHVVLVSKTTNWAHTLTPIAGLVWEFCDGTNSLDDILAHINSIPEIEPSPSLKQAIAVLLEEFEESGFLETSC